MFTRSKSIRVERIAFQNRRIISHFIGVRGRVISWSHVSFQACLISKNTIGWRQINQFYKCRNEDGRNLCLLACCSWPFRLNLSQFSRMQMRLYLYINIYIYNQSVFGSIFWLLAKDGIKDVCLKNCGASLIILLSPTAKFQWSSSCL